ncbi:MAG: toll/interleukin-1 receptor domain-containing protein, partial [Wenzhouxiangellaceae bacterium]
MTEVRYAAFISYRHEPADRAVATRLMNALERYRVPRELVKNGYPARLGKVFRDDDEMPATGNLPGEIEAALAGSQVQVVICSTATPRSLWVRREIQHFQQLGKGDSIFPVLIEGEPDESFPPELRHRLTAQGVEDAEPIGADLKPRPGDRTATIFERAKLRIAAGILGCGYDDLYQRERRRRQRWQRLAQAAAAVLFVGAGLLWNQFLRVHTEYCIGYVEEFGLPGCIDALTTEQASMQYRAYRLSRRNDRVFEMARINGSGSPVGDAETTYEEDPWTAGVAVWRFDHADGSGGFKVTHFAANGRQLRTLQQEFSPDRRELLQRFDVAFGVAERQRAGSGRLDMLAGIGNAGRTAIGQHRLRLDASGRIIERRYEPVGGGLTVPDEQGSHGQLYRRNAQGSIVRVENVDALGDIMIERGGVSAVQREYSTDGRLHAVHWLNAGGQPIANAQAFASVRIKRDPRERLREIRYFDAHGKPILRKDWGVARVTLAYGARGGLSELRFFGLDDQPILRKDSGVARINRTHDARGNLIEERY